MDKQAQIQKAEGFLARHHDPKLLVLPNIWDPLGARLLEDLGYPAVATASAAVAYSMGYDDGEKISFAMMLETIGRIAAAVDVPLTADIEQGYGESADEVADHAGQVLQAGAVGVNLEDSIAEGSPLRSIDSQCERIHAVRMMADREGIPLVINARTDVFMVRTPGSRSDKVAETIARGKAYRDAGADCIYPITVGDLDTIKVIREGIEAPINIFATAATASMKELEALGVSRLSLGPGLIKAALTTMKKIALGLKNYEPYDAFTSEAMSSEEIQRYACKAGGDQV